MDADAIRALIDADPTAVHIRRGGRDLHADPYTVRIIAPPTPDEISRPLAALIALPDLPLAIGDEVRAADGRSWVIID